MKTFSILVLTLGVVGVIANPVSKQTIPSENKNSARAESSDSQTKHGDVINTSNKGDQEQKKDTPIEIPESPNIIETSNDVGADGKVEIIIEENFVGAVDNDPLQALLPGDECEHDQDKYTPIENIETPHIDTDKTEVEIIIEENLVPQLQGDFSDEHLDVPQLSESIEDGPLGPQLPGEDSQMPNFIGEPQVTGDFVGAQLPGGYAGDPQFLGFVEQRPPLPGLIGGLPQLPGFIEGGPHMPGFNEHGPHHPDDEDDFLIDKDYFREDMQKIEHEIMETAAGFIPTPLVFRRKQKPRRRFATRRHFRRNPYRRHQLFYPYSYYSYYRPSSLRFY